jgi:hypothetical protein
MRETREEKSRKKAERKLEYAILPKFGLNGYLLEIYET